jgi:hypothetical protein
MDGLILDNRDQPVLEPVGGIGYPGTKDPMYHQMPTSSSSRICGLQKPIFWLAFALVLVVLGAAIGGGLGGGLSAVRKDINTSTR